MGEENNQQANAQGQEQATAEKKPSTLKANSDLLRLILILGGIVLVVLSYFFIFSPVSQENETLKMTLDQKEAEYQQMLAIASQADKYKQETEVAEANIQNILDSYPSAVQYEDEIYYIRDILETNNTSFDVKTMGFSPSLMVISSDQAIAANQAAAAAADPNAAAAADPNAAAAAADPNAAASAAGGVAGYQLYSTPLKVAGICGYEDIKSVLDYINHDNIKKNYDSVSLSFDTNTGLLSVSMNMNFLSIAGTEKEYEAATLPDYTGIGKSNIFGTAQ